MAPSTHPTTNNPPNPSPAATTTAASPEEEEDYMSMPLLDPPKPTHEKETYTQRRIRKAREAESKAHPPSAQERAAALTAALSTSLPTTSKGFQMMARLGFKAGTALGPRAGGRTEPLPVVVKEGRGGVGMESERKRKFREEVEGEARREREEEGGFRERVAREREERRVGGLARGAMGVLEGLEEEQEEVVGRKAKSSVLYRGLVRERELQERERRMRYDLHQSLSRSTHYADPEEEKQDRLAWGTQEEEEGGEEEDPELDAFEGLEPAERLRQVVECLREKYNYCFWCKFRYPDGKMEGCPGVTEEEHD